MLKLRHMEHAIGTMGAGSHQHSLSTDSMTQRQPKHLWVFGLGYTAEHLIQRLQTSQGCGRKRESPAAAASVARTDRSCCSHWQVTATQRKPLAQASDLHVYAYDPAADVPLGCALVVCKSSTCIPGPATRATQSLGCRSQAGQQALASATHVLDSIPPSALPKVEHSFCTDVQTLPYMSLLPVTQGAGPWQLVQQHCRTRPWIGVLSSTGVYGDHCGRLVTEQ